MADEAEELDWGGIEDEYFGEGHKTGAENDDVVSIGGEQDDMEELAAFKSRTQEEIAGDKNLQETANSESLAKLSSQMTDPVLIEPKAEHTPSAESPATQVSSKPSKPGPVQPPLKHALPPKPVTAPVSLRARNQANSELVGASAMSEPRRLHERDRDRDGGRRRSNASRPAATEILPPDWEIRYSTSGDKIPYYYNSRTGVTQWERPSATGKESPIGTKHTNELRDSQLDDRATRMSYEVLTERESDARVSNRAASPVLTFSDRHYRPSNNTESMSTRSSHRGRRDDSPDTSKHNDNHWEPSSSQRQSRSEKEDLGRRSENTRSRRDSLSENSNELYNARETFKVGPSATERETRRDAWPVEDLRSRMHRHDRDSPSEPPRTTDRPRDLSPPMGVNNVSLPHRRFRSRSPPPITRNTSKLHKISDSVSRAEAQDGLNGRTSHQEPIINPRQWGVPAKDRPVVRPPSPELQGSRRSRKSDNSSKLDFGNEPKRRRIDDPFEERSREQRDRTPPILESRDRFYPDPHPEDMAGSYRHRELNNDQRQRKRPEEAIHPRRTVDEDSQSRRLPINDRDRIARLDNRNTYEGVPSGPRQDRFSEANRDFDDRTFIQSGPKLETNRNDSFRTDSRPQISRGRGLDDSMDIDVSRSKFSSPSQSSKFRERAPEGGLLDERHDSSDRLPTGPRKMLEKRPSQPTSSPRHRNSRLNKEIDPVPGDISEPRIWIPRDAIRVAELSDGLRATESNSSSMMNNSPANGSRPAANSYRPSRDAATINSNDSFSNAPPPSSTYDSPRPRTFTDLPERQDGSRRFVDDERLSRSNSSRPLHTQSVTPRQRVSGDERGQDSQPDRNQTAFIHPSRLSLIENTKGRSQAPQGDGRPRTSTIDENSRVASPNNINYSRKVSPKLSSSNPVERPAESRPNSLLERINMGSGPELSKSQGISSQTSSRGRLNASQRRRDELTLDPAEEIHMDSGLSDANEGSRNGRSNRSGRYRGRARRGRSRSGLVDV